MCSILKYILFGLMTLSVGSCSSEGCDNEGQASLLITIFGGEDNLQQLTDSITLYGVGMPDSLLYDMANTDKMLVQLDPVEQLSSFVIINGTTYDTINIEYESRYHFISKPCGYSYLFDIKNITFSQNSIMNVTIIDSEVNFNEKENLRTFY